MASSSSLLSEAELQQSPVSSRAPEKPAKSQVLCDFCCETKSAALKSCLICMASCCDTHLELHQTVASFKKHKLMDPVENLEDYICQKHERPLELFCRDDQTCVCQFCTEGDHKTHSTVPIEEEIQVKKIQMETTQAEVHQMIQDRLNKIEEIKQSVELNKVYPSLSSPLQSKDWNDITVNTTLSVENLRRALSQLQKALNKEKDKLPDIKLKRMPEYAVDVTLDPDSAHPELILSDDGKQVTLGKKQNNLPENPERFDRCACVLGKEGFSSGRFYYEVQVKGKTAWDLGVTTESSNRKGPIIPSPEDGYWTLWLRNKTEYRALDSPRVPLSLKQAPQKVGVFVDYEEGLVSFYDVEASSHIYSFTGQSFTEKLYPYFSPSDNKESVPMPGHSYTTLFKHSFTTQRPSSFLSSAEFTLIVPGKLVHHMKKTAKLISIFCSDNAALLQPWWAPKMQLKGFQFIAEHKENQSEPG
ncbi:hypothetical protein MHYP_G00015420 [Metynnis hypsauchen]